MTTVIPANPGFSVLFADMQSIRDCLADDPNASIGGYVGCQSVIAWDIRRPTVLPITYTYIGLTDNEFRVVEETDRQALEAIRKKWAREIYSEVTNEKGQAR